MFIVLLFFFKNNFRTLKRTQISLKAAVLRVNDALISTFFTQKNKVNPFFKHIGRQ